MTSAAAPTGDNILLNFAWMGPTTLDFVSLPKETLMSLKHLLTFLRK